MAIKYESNRKMKPHRQDSYKNALEMSKNDGWNDEINKRTLIIVLRVQRFARITWKDEKRAFYQTFDSVLDERQIFEFITLFSSHMFCWQEILL